MKRSYFTLLLLPLLFTSCSNNPSTPAVTITGVSLLNSPTKAKYTVGEYFAPSGLSVTVSKSDSSSYNVSYLGNEEDFSFSPSLTTPLTEEITTVTATYEGFNVSIPVTVSEEETKTVTMEFTVTHSVDESGIKTQGNTDKPDKLAETINHYYIDSEDISISSISGEYFQIQNGWNVTPSRNVGQMLLLGSRSYDVDATLKFSTAVKSITFVCEAYSKYVSSEHYTNHNVDYDTYLEVNGTKNDIPAHQKEDADETQTLKYTVNSTDVHIVCPQPNPDDPNSMAKRIMVYQIVLEF